MKTVNNLVGILTALTFVKIISSGRVSGIMFFIAGAVIISIGRYGYSFLTSKS